MELSKIISKILSHEIPQRRINAGNLFAARPGGMREYPDKSRYFDDFISLICYVNSGESYYTIIVNSLLNHISGMVQADFNDGQLTTFHKHNYIELAYVADGTLRQRVAGMDEQFETGEICLMSRDTIHADYLFREKSVAAFMGITNSFIDQYTGASNDGQAAVFLREIINPKEKYRFIRFTPKTKKPEIPVLLGHILTEMRRPRAGTIHLVSGYAERILSMLHAEYHYDINKNNKTAARHSLFDEIQLYLAQNYQDVSMEALTGNFGHSIDYYNRLIRQHTGMTYSKFLQNIRLEKAEYLLRTTRFTVENIARQVGYENQGYFYKIFTEKYKKTPNQLRKT